MNSHSLFVSLFLKICSSSHHQCSPAYRQMSLPASGWLIWLGKNHLHTLISKYGRSRGRLIVYHRLSGRGSSLQPMVGRYDPRNRHQQLRPLLQWTSPFCLRASEYLFSILLSHVLCQFCWSISLQLYFQRKGRLCQLPGLCSTPTHQSGVRFIWPVEKFL